MHFVITKPNNPFATVISSPHTEIRNSKLRKLRSSLISLVSKKFKLNHFNADIGELGKVEELIHSTADNIKNVKTGGGTDTHILEIMNTIAKREEEMRAKH